MSNEPRVSRSVDRQPEQADVNSSLHDISKDVRNAAADARPEASPQTVGGAQTGRITVVPVPPLSETSLFESPKHSRKPLPAPAS